MDSPVLGCAVYVLRDGEEGLVAIFAGRTWRTSEHAVTITRRRISRVGPRSRHTAPRGAQLIVSPLSHRICSVVSTYPLDLVRSRLSIISATIGNRKATLAGKELSMMGMTKKVYREEGGIRALYRGLVPTAVGVAPCEHLPLPLPVAIADARSSAE